MGRPKTVFDEHFEAQLRDIETNREKYIKAFIAETGFKPSEVMQVHAPMSVDGTPSRVYWCMKRGLATDIDQLIAEVTALREERDHWRHQAKYATDSSELQPGEEAYERLQAENAKLREELALREKFPELGEPSGPDWPFGAGVPFSSDAGIDFVTAINALVKAARGLDTAIANGEVYNDDDEVIAFRAALQPFEPDWTPLGEATKPEGE